MKRVLIFILITLLIAACDPVDVIPTSTPTDIPTNTPTSEPTNTPTDEPTNTPTVESTPTLETPRIEEDGINSNSTFYAGCETIFKFPEFAGREVCSPHNWDWNLLNFQDNQANQPPPDVKWKDNPEPDGLNDYLRLRIDYLEIASQYCLSQHIYLPNSDFSGNEIVYIFKATVDLNAPAINQFTRPSIHLLLHTDGGKLYTKITHPITINEQALLDGKHDYLWVIDPVPATGLTTNYQFCFDFYGINGGEQFADIYNLAVLRANKSWGLDRQQEIE